MYLYPQFWSFWAVVAVYVIVLCFRVCNRNCYPVRNRNCCRGPHAVVPTKVMLNSENDLAELLASDDGPFLIKVSIMRDQQRVPPPSSPPPPQPTYAPDPRIPPARGLGASPSSVYPDAIFQQQPLGAERSALVEHQVLLQQQLQGYRDHQHEQQHGPEHGWEKKVKEPQHASGWGADGAAPPVDAAAVMSVARQYLDQEQRRQALRSRRRSSSSNEARESSAVRLVLSLLQLPSTTDNARRDSSVVKLVLSLLQPIHNYTSSLPSRPLTKPSQTPSGPLPLLQVFVEGCDSDFRIKLETPVGHRCIIPHFLVVVAAFPFATKLAELSCIAGDTEPSPRAHHGR